MAATILRATFKFVLSTYSMIFLADRWFKLLKRPLQTKNTLTLFYPGGGRGDGVFFLGYSFDRLINDEGQGRVTFE